MKILLDTNILLLPHSQKIDVFSEIERIIPEKHGLYTLSTIVEELESITGACRDAISARVALKLIEEKNVKILDSQGHPDDALLKLAVGEDYLVATNDRGLKKRLKNNGKPMICMRGKNRLEKT